MDDTNSILVVGGGIGGMQASLELADMGFHVYLVEAAPAIGGMMAQLDKTFPTNDCAMCMLSPIMVEVGRHPAIEVLAYSEVESLEGDLGLFKALVKR
ncbi:MAG: FAD-dependent oxidoreductase, partial [Candidatus Bipolaricaulia bacterium]